MLFILPLGSHILLFLSPAGSLSWGCIQSVFADRVKRLMIQSILAFYIWHHTTRDNHIIVSSNPKLSLRIKADIIQKFCQTVYIELIVFPSGSVKRWEQAQLALPKKSPKSGLPMNEIILIWRVCSNQTCNKQRSLYATDWDSVEPRSNRPATESRL